MTPQHVITQLLKSDEENHNVQLLRKLILTAYFGRFRVNGQPPDNKIPLGNYLFDEERMMFDFTHLSAKKRDQFLHWLLDPHQEKKEKKKFSRAGVNEYRGFTAERPLGLWKSFKNWVQGKHSDYWAINDFGQLLDYKLHGIEIVPGKDGLLVGFDQSLVPDSGDKYKSDDDLEFSPLGNVKRIHLTNKMVDQLISGKLNSKNIEQIITSAHPHAVPVMNEKRHEEMYAYRKTHEFIPPKPWYVRLWLWICSWFASKPEKKPYKSSAIKLNTLDKDDDICIYQNESTQEIIVTEKKPGIDNLVFCGGGAKIFAHVGVIKALNEAHIAPTKFAGSSAGAIMALLCYLGYTATQIAEFFTNFKQEHLMYLDYDMKGLSGSHSLKTSLDFIIANRVQEIVTQYNIPYPVGKITFATLEELSKQCPGCGIGDELIVTATQKRTRTTRYFSFKESPLIEVSEAVKTSASFPVLYRPTMIDGEEHNDGGVLSNFPTEVFADDQSTFLESVDGNNFKVLAVQFDNGTERDTVDRRDRVYREGAIANWFYKLITGVHDPASGWEADRIKLRKYAGQSVIVDVGNVSSSSFSVSEEVRKKMVQSGYDATNRYLDARYSTPEEEDSDGNDECMYSSFTSLCDLLVYCCYRGDKRWFDRVSALIAESELPNKKDLMVQALTLKELYFNDNAEPSLATETKNEPSLFGTSFKPIPVVDENAPSPKLLLALYPIFLKFSAAFVQAKADKDLYDKARHTFTLDTPFQFLDGFHKFNGEIHIALYLFIKLSENLINNGDESTFELLALLKDLLNQKPMEMSNSLFGKWDLSTAQVSRVLKLWHSNPNNDDLMKLLTSLRDKIEPLKNFQGGTFNDDFSDGCDEGDWAPSVL